VQKCFELLVITIFSKFTDKVQGLQLIKLVLLAQWCGNRVFAHIKFGTVKLTLGPIEGLKMGSLKTSCMSSIVYILVVRSDRSSKLLPF